MFYYFWYYFSSIRTMIDMLLGVYNNLFTHLYESDFEKIMLCPPIVDKLTIIITDVFIYLSVRNSLPMIPLSPH